MDAEKLRKTKGKEFGGFIFSPKTLITRVPYIIIFLSFPTKTLSANKQNINAFTDKQTERERERCTIVAMRLRMRGQDEAASSLSLWSIVNSL
jgi:hypothetical protein